MIAIAAEIEASLRTMTSDAFSQVEGVPAEDANAWRPRLGLEDINTFYALLTHLISSGEWWILAVAAGRPSNRNRSSEFVATGNVGVLRARADRWLSEAHDWLETLTGDDFGRVVRFTWPRTGAPGEATVGYCLVHAVEHTAAHVGHLQIQRQIWDAEMSKRS